MSSESAVSRRSGGRKGCARSRSSINRSRISAWACSSGAKECSSCAIADGSSLGFLVVRAQELEGAPDQDAHGPFAFAHDGGDLGSAESMRKAQAQNLLLLRRQTLERCLQFALRLLAQHHLFGSLRRRFLHPLGEDAQWDDWMACRAPIRVHQLVLRHAKQP